MTRHARRLGTGALLALGIAVLAGANAARADDEEDKAIKEAQKQVDQVAKGVEEGKLDKTAVAKIKAKFDELNTVMHGFKPRKKKGFGVGAKPEAIVPDGIELKLLDMGKRKMSKIALTKDKDALVKMAYRTAAIAEVAKLYAPTKPKGGKGPADWKKYATDMKKYSLELIDALKKGDPAQVKTVTNNLNSSCNSCHTDFRDVN
jgi:cytochrome c556